MLIYLLVSERLRGADWPVNLAELISALATQRPPSAVALVDEGLLGAELRIVTIELSAVLDLDLA